MPALSMPLVEPSADNDANTAAYGAMTLSKTTRVVTAQSDSATEYRFTIDASTDASFKTLFGMCKCVVKFYAAGTEIPFFSGGGKSNSYNPGVPCLEMTLLEVSVTDLQPAFPARASPDINIKRCYCLNFEESSLETHLVGLIQSNHGEDELRARLDFIGHPTTKTGHDLAVEYFTWFKSEPTLFVLANGGEPIADLSENSSGSAPLYGLTAYFGTGTDLGALSWDAEDSVRSYFQYYKRLRNDSFLPSISLSGHPMISHVLGVTPGECRVDFLDDDEQPSVDKYLSNTLALDADVHPNVLVVPTTNTVDRNGQTFPSSNGEVDLYIYNPEGEDLVVTSSDSSLLSIDGAAESNIASTVFVTLKALTAATGSATLYVRRRSDSTEIRSLTVQFLEVHSVPIKFFKLRDDVHEGDGDGDGVATLIDEVNAILGPQANVYIYSVDVDGDNEPVVGETSISGNLGNVVYLYPKEPDPAVPSPARSPEYERVLDEVDTTYRYNYFFIWSLQTYPGEPMDMIAGTQLHRDSHGTRDAISTIDDRFGHVDAQVLAHEIGHGLSKWKYGPDTGTGTTDSEKLKHFDHEGSETSNYLEGDHRLPKNFMRDDDPLMGEHKVTFTQGRLLNECAAEVGV